MGGCKETGALLAGGTGAGAAGRHGAGGLSLAMADGMGGHQLFQVRTAAVGAMHLLVSVPDQGLEAVMALSAFVFIDRHGFSFPNNTHPSQAAAVW